MDAMFDYTRLVEHNLVMKRHNRMERLLAAGEEQQKVPKS